MQEKGKIKTVADIIGEFIDRITVVKDILKKVLADQRETDARLDMHAMDIEALQMRVASLELVCGRVFENHEVNA